MNLALTLAHPLNHSASLAQAYCLYSSPEPTVLTTL